MEHPELLDNLEFDPEKFDIEQLSPEDILKLPLVALSGLLLCLDGLTSLSRESLFTVLFRLFLILFISDKNTSLEQFGLFFDKCRGALYTGARGSSIIGGAIAELTL